MALEIPKSPKVYTTVYDNFKGVDYTNDATNIYKRRSPSGRNMIPNLDGKPYKRKGWEKAITKEDFCFVYSEATGTSYDGNVEIKKCAYFEIAGTDHIAVFTDIGLFIVRATELSYEVELVSTDNDVKDSYDRTFFFEGNGTSAFYVYGNFRIWAYKWDEGYSFSEQEPYVPAIRISVSADGLTATPHDDMNLVGNKVAEEFQNNNRPYITRYVGASAVNEELFLLNYSGSKTYAFTYKDDAWYDENDGVVTLSGIGITPIEGSMYITVSVTYENIVYLYGKLTSDAGVRVFVADPENPSEKYGKELRSVSGTPSTGEYRVTTKNGKSVIMFHESYEPLIDGADAIRVEYPIQRFEVTHHEAPEATVQVVIGGVN